jgi:hypothetical protein
MKTFDHTYGIRLDLGEHVSVRYTARTKKGLYVNGYFKHPVGHPRGPQLSSISHGTSNLAELEAAVKALGVEVEYEKHLSRAISI